MHISHLYNERIMHVATLVQNGLNMICTVKLWAALKHHHVWCRITFVSIDNRTTNVHWETVSMTTQFCAWSAIPLVQVTTMMLGLVLINVANIPILTLRKFRGITINNKTLPLEGMQHTFGILLKIDDINWSGNL